jgi:mannose-1-phosphate guanylyltransferase/mannose-6-phosphate isomerase
MPRSGFRAGQHLARARAQNCARAIAAAALAAQANGADRVLLVLPSDHVVANVPVFNHAVSVGINAAEGGALVTFGIVPMDAETGYGYGYASQALDSNAAVSVQHINPAISNPF